MRRPELSEIASFVAVAERGNFARAATKLGIPRSTLSEKVRALEENLGVRLLNRTTRSVALTQSGTRLLAQVRPWLEGFDASIESARGSSGSPTGPLRLTVPRAALGLTIEPVLARFLETYPGITLEIAVDSALTDIVSHKFDAGIRVGQRLQRDMIAVRLARTVAAVLASPDYLRSHAPIVEPRDLKEHQCIRRRFASGALQDRWSFARRGKSTEVKVSGRLIVDDAALAVRAAAGGVGVCYVLIEHAAPLLAQGRLVRLLETWAPSPTEFFLYYPGSRHVPAPLRALIQFLRRRP